MFVGRLQGRSSLFARLGLWLGPHRYQQRAELTYARDGQDGAGDSFRFATEEIGRFQRDRTWCAVGQQDEQVQHT